MTHTPFRLLLLATVPLLVLLAAAPVAEVIESVDGYRVLPVGAFVLAAVLLLAAGGLVVYVASSLALDVERSRQRASNSIDDAFAESRRRGRRRGRVVRNDQLVTAVREGATSVEEVADLLDSHLHLVRTRLDELVDKERLTLRDGRYGLPEPKERATARAPHWIGADDQ